ncbi:hypothetical protein [Arthrobacter sp. TMS1-12-1]
MRISGPVVDALTATGGSRYRDAGPAPTRGTLIASQGRSLAREAPGPDVIQETPLRFARPSSSV